MISRRLSKCKPMFAAQSPAHFGSSGQFVNYLTKEETAKKDTDLPGTAVESHPPTQGLLSTLLNEIKPWFCLWA